jgi:catechol 2,3-dioxygenase-like lactoylglutathione lyase family enzyme
VSTTAETTIRVNAAPVSGLVPMIQVGEVERSLEFYRLLGFEVGNKVPEERGLQWAWLYAPKVSDWRRGPNLMLSRSDKPVNAGIQVLFYLYVADLTALREQLIAAGVKVSEISYPDYLPKGEFETHDPDGYMLMLAQSAEDTP